MSAAPLSPPPLLGRLEWSSGLCETGARALVWMGGGAACDGDALPPSALLPRAARARALGRIAATMAVQLLDPESREITILNDEQGRPYVGGDRCRSRPGPHVSIAHKQHVAAAVAGWTSCGIDLEPVECRSATFERTALAPSEQALEPCEDRDTWLTRLWTVKEAVAKAGGRGLQGRPRDFEVRPVKGHSYHFECLGFFVRTEIVDAAGRPHVVAWTAAGS